MYSYSRRVDIELGLRSSRFTPTSLQDSEHEGPVVSPAPMADQIGEAAGLDQMAASVQDSELRSTLPTTVDAEVDVGPSSVHKGRIGGSEAPNPHTTALTETEHQNLRAEAIHHLELEQES